MRNKLVLWGVILLQAMPVPLSLATILGSVISFADMMMLQPTSVVAVAGVAMALCGTYTLTYIFSAIFSLVKKKLNFISFLPILHLVLAIGFVALWAMIEV